MIELLPHFDCGIERRFESWVGLSILQKLCVELKAICRPRICLHNKGNSRRIGLQQEFKIQRKVIGDGKAALIL